MSKYATIIHGWGADSTSNWFPWLAGKLREQDWIVEVPDFPNTMSPQLEEWLEYFKDVAMRKPTTLIGHSLGVPFILRLLENTDNQQYKAAYLVSGYDRSLGIPEIDNFTDKPFDWKKIHSNCKKFIVINSDNDPYIPLEIAESLASNLKTKLVVEHNGDHLNAPVIQDNAYAYPRLLKLIEST